MEYARNEGLSIPGGYKIISQRAKLRHLYWDGNSPAELGFDNGKGYAYKNTKNNRKLADAVTRDEDGNIVPLSKRFNPRKEEEYFQDKDSPRGFFDPATRDITMLAKVDLSTFLHEVGHLFLEIQAELAMDENATDRMKSDMDAVLQWFGVEGKNASERLAAWNAMTLEQKRPCPFVYSQRPCLSVARTPAAWHSILDSACRTHPCRQQRLSFRSLDLSLGRLSLTLGRLIPWRDQALRQTPLHLRRLCEYLH